MRNENHVIRRQQFTTQCNGSGCPNSATVEMTTAIDDNNVKIRPIRICDECALEMENENFDSMPLRREMLANDERDEAHAWGSAG